HFAVLCEERLVSGIDPIEASFKRSGAGSILQPHDPVEHDEATVRRGVTGLVIPEIKAVDVAVAEPEAALVLLVSQLARDHFHGVLAGDNRTGCGANGMKIGLGCLRPGNIQSSKWFAIHLDGDAI